MKKRNSKKQAIPVDLDWKREYKKLSKFLYRVNKTVTEMIMKRNSDFVKLDSLFSEVKWY
jgi:hypothetical protein